MKPIKHKLPSDHEEWLENRLKGIGGSDAGAVLGFNQYKSPYALWCEKTERIENTEDNEAMRIGRDLEDYVAQRFTEATGKKVRKSGYSFQSSEHPFMLANIDRWIIGENAGLECKTTNILTKTKYDKGDIPATYYAQCMHYMAVTGADKWYIAVIVLGKGFYWYEILRDEEEIKALIEAEEEFWKLVESDTPPSVDDSPSTTEALDELYSVSNGESFEMFGRDDVLDDYINLKTEKKNIEQKIIECENILKSDMKEYERAYCSNYSISWKNQTRNSIDQKKLKDEYPEIYENVIRQTQSRVFRVKEN